MEVQALLPEITNNFLEDYLISCGVNDVGIYLSADLNCVDSPFQYIDMDKAVLRYKTLLRKKKKLVFLLILMLMVFYHLPFYILF